MPYQTGVVTPRPRRRAARIVVLLPFLLAGPALVAAAHAQAAPAAAPAGLITGVVRDSSGSPLPSAEVQLVGTATRTTSDAQGAFRLAGVGVGQKTLRVRRIGFRAREVPVTVAEGATAEVTVTLGRLAQELEPVRVEARRDIRAMHLASFYERKKRGIGRFLTRENIDNRQAPSLPELLRSEIPGVQIVSTRWISQAVRLRGQRCAPLVFIDGTAAPAAEFDLTTISPWTLSGVEVYSGASTVPIEFTMTRGLHACGVIALWSRNDAIERPRQRKRPPVAPDTGILSRVYAADEVDVPARVDTTQLQDPVYPDSLYAQGVSGEVVAEFVIDTSGRAIPESFGVVSSTHVLFNDAVKAAVLESKFQRATKGGRPVRQVIVVPFRFEMENEKKERRGS
jgi:TonB family protein